VVLDQSFRLGALGRNGVTMVAGSRVVYLDRLDFFGWVYSVDKFIELSFSVRVARDLLSVVGDVDPLLSH